MSSLRNAIQRRNHRERAQPVERAKWGILEKHKDYKLRAADHNVKKRKIKTLKEKVAARNEDEFYFAMMNSSTQGGVKRAKRGEENAGGSGKSLDLDVVKLLKTQDQGYLQTMLQRTKKERERMEQAVAVHETGVSVMPSERRVVFNESGEIENGLSTPDELDLDGADDMSLVDFDLDISPSEDDSADSQENVVHDAQLTPEQRKAKQLRKRTLTAKRRKLSMLEEQEKKLSQALSRLDHQRAKMNGTVGGISKRGVSFGVRHRKR